MASGEQALDCPGCALLSYERSDRGELVCVATMAAAARGCPLCSKTQAQPRHVILQALQSSDRFASFLAGRMLAQVYTDPIERMNTLQANLASTWPDHALANAVEVAVQTIRVARESDVDAPLVQSADRFRQTLETLCRDDRMNRPIECIAALGMTSALCKLYLSDEDTLPLMYVQLLEFPTGMLHHPEAAVMHKALQVLGTVVGALLRHDVLEDVCWDKLTMIGEQLIKLVQQQDMCAGDELSILLGGVDSVWVMGVALSTLGDIAMAGCSRGDEEWLRRALVIPNIHCGSLILQLYSNDDPSLIHAMRQLLVLWVWCQERGLNTPDSAHPYLIFEHLLETLGFDHQVLLDFLISPETHEFVQYISQFLRSVQATHPIIPDTRLIICLQQLQASIQKLVSRQLFPYNCAPILRRLKAVIDMYS